MEEEKGKGVKRAYSDDMDDGIRVIVNKPGFVAAVGGIPDELKLNGGISFAFPCATFNYLNTLSEDRNECAKVLDDAYKQAIGKNMYNFIQALNKAQGVSSFSKQSEEEVKTPNIGEKPPTMVEVNLDVSTSLDNYSFIAEESESESESKEGTHKTTHKIDDSPQSKLGYFPSTFSGGNIHALTRDCGDSIEVLLYKGVIINKPGVVAAVGGIPDELKLKDGFSFSYPCPSYKICKEPTHDHGKQHKLQFDAFDGAMERKAFIRTMQNAYNKARGISSSQPEKEKAHTNDQLSLAMMEVNVDRSIDHIFQWSRECVFYGYSHHYSQSGTMKLLLRDCGDHIEILLYKGVVINNPGLLVIAAGGIPDELKINGALSLSYPSPAMKILKDLFFDPAQHQKAVDDAYHEVWGQAACLKAMSQAYIKAWYSSISKQPENMDQQPLSMVEVNLAVPPRIGSSSHELKDSNMEK